MHLKVIDGVVWNSKRGRETILGGAPNTRVYLVLFVIFDPMCCANRSRQVHQIIKHFFGDTFEFDAAFLGATDTALVVASNEHHRESRERCVEASIRLRRRARFRPQIFFENKKNLGRGRSKE